MNDSRHETVQLRDHRLEEALEALDEGFSLWDAGDRLLVCNSRYRALYPCVADLLVPGVQFETVVRTALERGQFPVSGRAREEWLERRLRDHREPPPEPFEQQLVDGRWLLVAERRTPAGHTVGTRTDITGRKKLELALARLASVSSVPGLDLAARVREVLRLGAEHFALPFGLVSRVDRRELEVVHAVSPRGELEAGMRMPLEDSFCARTLRGGLTLDVISDDCDRSSPHPFVQRFGFRSYLGTQYAAGHEISGTVCFFGQETRHQAIPEGDRELLRLLARWIGHEIDRDRALSELSDARANLHRLASTDDLTGLLNRRALLDFGRAEFYRARRYGHQLCALAVDVDHFKDVNERFGHAEGDRVLQAVARSCQRCVRDHDGVGRTGGEEFAMVLIEARAAQGAAIAERIREAIAARRFDSGARVTLSIGVAESRGDDQDFEALLARADCALGEAKDRGRNQVCAAGS